MISFFFILAPPQITEKPQNITAIEGIRVTFSCNASGDPEPTVSWTKDGSILSPVNDVRISFGAESKSLTIMNISRRDSGQYRCVASNSLGNVSSAAATLDVQCKEIFSLASPYE